MSVKLRLSHKKVDSQTTVQMYVIKFKAKQYLSCIYFTLIKTGSEKHRLIKKKHGNSGGGSGVWIKF